MRLLGWCLAFRSGARRRRKFRAVYVSPAKMTGAQLARLLGRGGAGCDSATSHTFAGGAACAAAAAAEYACFAGRNGCTPCNRAMVRPSGPYAPGSGPRGPCFSGARVLARPMAARRRAGGAHVCYRRAGASAACAEVQRGRARGFGRILAPAHRVAGCGCPARGRRAGHCRSARSPSRNPSAGADPASFRPDAWPGAV